MFQENGRRDIRLAPYLVVAMPSCFQRVHLFASHYCDGIKTSELNMDKMKSLALLLVKITPTSDSRLGTCVRQPRKPYLDALVGYGVTGVAAYIFRICDEGVLLFQFG